MRILLILLLAFSGLQLYGQANSEAPKKHELRLNILNTVMGTVEGQYERIFNDNSSVGINLGFGYAISEINDILNLWSLTPQYRVYFGRKRAQGLFLEANCKISKDGFYNLYDQRTSSTVNFSPGSGIGWKYVTAGNLVISSKAGIGIFPSYADFGALETTGYSDFEIGIGKRF